MEETNYAILLHTYNGFLILDKSWVQYQSIHVYP